MQHLFEQIDATLCQYKSLWQTEPFHLSRHSSLPWETSFADICHWLEQITPQQIEIYKSNSSALTRDISKVFPSAASFPSLTQLDDCSHQNINLDCSPRLHQGIPGRKLAQINAMGAYVLANHQGNEWLEWCSGKGYLGRILAVNSQQPVTSFEWQEALCLQGQIEADKQQLPMHFVQGDALAASSRELLKEDQHAVALHACGDLHTKLMQHAADAKTAAITISPCCYHLVAEDYYQPLSPAAKCSSLILSRDMLRIPLQETVTGGKRVARHREQEMVFRLGLDSLLRESLHVQDYIPVPSIKKSELSKGFVYFCQWAAEKKQLTLPDADYDHWLEVGQQRFWKMEKMNLVQQLFRRLLEVWLVLDRGLYLQQHGYHVSLHQFCCREMTPRNILIHAVLKCSQDAGFKATSSVKEK